jgi:TonB family protein
LIAVVVLALLAQATPAPWAASVSDGLGEGERPLNALLTPLAAPFALRLELSGPATQPRRIDYEAGDKGTAALFADLHTALEQSNATLFVLTIDTLVPLQAGRNALSAASGTAARVELRFAGPTKVKGQPMPEVLQLNKEVPQQPPLTAQQIRAVVQAKYPAVRECYQQQLEANALEGTLVIALTVMADGSVADAEIKNSALSAPEVHTCILALARTLKFPKLRGAPTFRVTWPFVFKKGEDKPAPPPIRK